MVRLLVLVEGETEETFINDALAPYLYGTNQFTGVSTRLLGNPSRRSRRGGIVAWSSAKRDILRHLREDREVMIALLVDYYGLPQRRSVAWPGRAASTGADSVEAAVQHCIRRLMGEGFHEDRFVPCVMMHEFEAMLFSDCDALANAVGEPDSAAELRSILGQFAGPEDINDSKETAPSKRISNLVPSYNKRLHGNRAVNMIGLDRIRDKCPHFSDWLGRLASSAEKLARD